MIFISSAFGHDISTWQDSPTIAGTVNFRKMKDNGASFVIFRASIGTVPDVDFEKYKVNSRGVLPRGVYHYWYNTVTPQAQADALIASIGGERLEGRVWLDLENDTAGAYNKPRHWWAFCEILESKGYRVGTYTGYYWWQKYAIATGADLSYFYARPLWQAWYNPNPANVLIAGKWSRMMIWQDTSTGGGYAAGVESPDIDHDKWNDAYNFATEWTTGDPMKIYDIKGLMNIRATASATGTDIGDLLINDRVEVTVVQVTSTDKWGKLSKITRAGVNVALPAAVCYVSLNTANTVEFIPPAGDIAIDMTLKADGTIVGTWTGT